MFCNQCGSQIPDNVTICPNCGANIAPNPVQAQNPGVGQVPQPPLQNMNAGQMQQPVQGMNAGQIPPQQNASMNAGINAGMNAGQMQQNAGYGQPGMQQSNPQMYNGMPMQGYGQPAQPKANPLAFLTASHPGEPFPLKGVFSVKALLSKITTLDLIGIIGALVAFISVFLPFISAYGESISMVKLSDADVNSTWMVIVLSIGAIILYTLRMEMLAFLVSALNLLVFVHMWTLGSALKSFGGHLSVGFYFYLLATIAMIIAPFVWGRIKKTN